MRLPLILACLLSLPMVAPAQTASCGLFEAVEPGDDIAAIARRCGLDPAALRRDNPDTADPPAPGSVLRLAPVPRPGAGSRDDAQATSHTGTASRPSGDAPPAPRLLGAQLDASPGARPPSRPVPAVPARTGGARRDGAATGSDDAPSGAAAAEGPRQAYAGRVIGLWHAEGDRCDAAVTTWDFAPDRVRGHRVTYDITGFGGEADAPALQLSRRPDGRTLSLRIAMLERGRLRLSGPGILVDLLRCDAGAARPTRP